MSSRGRIHRAPLALAAALTVVVGVGGGAGVYFAGEREESSIERVAELTDVLAVNEGPAENYLIVGSDTATSSTPSPRTPGCSSTDRPAKVGAATRS